MQGVKLFFNCVKAGCYIIDNIDNDNNEKNNEKHANYLNFMRQNSKSNDKFFKF